MVSRKRSWIDEIAGFEDGREPWVKEWRLMDTNAPLEPPEGALPDWHLGFRTSNFENYKIINLSHLHTKPVVICCSNNRKLIQGGTFKFWGKVVFNLEIYTQSIKNLLMKNEGRVFLNLQELR